MIVVHHVLGKLIIVARLQLMGVDIFILGTSCSNGRVKVIEGTSCNNTYQE